MEIAANPLSRPGVFPYTAKSVGMPGFENDPGKIVMVWRPEEELNNPETLDSVRLQPWTDDHTMLGDPNDDPSLTPPERKGVHGVIGERVFYDPDEQMLKGNLRLWSPSLGDAIDAGKKELSMGFRCVYDFTPGEFQGQHFDAIQRNIRFNHLATVQEGRMGPGVAVLDHLKFTFDASELRELPTMKTTRRLKMSKKLGVAPTALAAACGMDGADAAVLAKWNLAMDAEEEDDKPDAGGGGEPTISEAVEMIKDVAGPVSELQAALAELSGGGGDPDGQTISEEDMEPMVDAAGSPVMDPATGKQKMKKKVAAPVADATPPALAACDSAIKALRATSAAAHRALKGAAAPAQLVAFDASITGAQRAYDAARAVAARKPGAAMDARLSAIETSIKVALDGTSMTNAFAEIVKRDKLAARLSPFVGTFDASEMTTAQVAKYGAEKLGLKVEAGHEVAALDGYLHNRTSQISRPASSFGLDAAATSDKSVSDYLSGHAA